MILRSFVLAAVLLLTSSSFASDSTTDFRKIIAAQGFFGTASGESWPYAGGFLVMRKNGGIVTFIDVPDAMKPHADELENVEMSFPKVERTGRMTFSVVLQGLEAIIGGNPGIGMGHSSDMTFAQLDADGTAITYIRADKQVNETTAPQLKNWKDSGLRVFVVGIALTTKSISISTDASTNIDATWNGSAASNCPTNGDNPNGNSNGQPTTNYKPASPGPQALTMVSWPPSRGSEESRFIGQAGGNQNNGNGTANPTKPGGDFHFCKQSSNKVTLTTTQPLVFAMGAYEVISTNLIALSRLTPIMSVCKNCGPLNEIEIVPGSGGGSAGQEMTKPNTKVASSSKPKWGHLSWDDRGKLE